MNHKNLGQSMLPIFGCPNSPIHLKFYGRILWNRQWCANWFADHGLCSCPYNWRPFVLILRMSITVWSVVCSVCPEVMFGYSMWSWMHGWKPANGNACSFSNRSISNIRQIPNQIIVAIVSMRRKVSLWVRYSYVLLLTCLKALSIADGRTFT